MDHSRDDRHLADVVGQMRHGTKQGLGHRVGFAADVDRLGDSVIVNRRERRFECCPPNIEMVQKRLPVAIPIGELRVTIPVRFLTIRGQEIRPTTAKISPKVPQYHGYRIDLRFGSRKQFIVGELFNRCVEHPAVSGNRFAYR